MEGILPPLDLSSLPVPDVVEALSFEEIKAAMVADLESRDPAYTAILESDPAMKVIEVCAYRELLIRQRVNDAARETYLSEATGSNLDAIGALFNVARLPGEDDERFRERIQLGLAGLAAAGPRRAYEYHAMSVDPSIVNVGVHSPAPGEVSVSVLASIEVGVEEATEDQLTIGRALFDQPSNISRAVILMPSDDAVMDDVREQLNQEDVRPMTDSVVVKPPEVLAFTVSAGLVVLPGPDAQTVLDRAKLSLAAYLRRVRLVSYDATRAGITSALMVPGVQNVLLDSPAADVVAGPGQLVVATDITVTVEGSDA